MEKVKIAVLVSGGGTNLQALLDSEKNNLLVSGEIVLVVADREDAYALTRAKNSGIEAITISKKQYKKEFDTVLLEALRLRKIQMIVLAGFTTILSAEFVSHYPDRIINVHPALIPQFCGKGFYGIKVHEAVLAADVRFTGATTHYVNEICDGGEIIMQKKVEVKPDDTAESLQLRVMQEAEWIILPLSCERVAERIRKMNLYEYLQSDTYQGRGILIGSTEEFGVVAYFIMGRSDNSRNRIFAEEKGNVTIYPFDFDKVEDPSLIIYSPLKRLGEVNIISNGDQTDTIYDFLERGEGNFFENALTTRCFEPDEPHFTPRISGMLYDDGDYALSILKRDKQTQQCERQYFYYNPKKNRAHLIHTYQSNDNPLPSFEGAPREFELFGGIDEITDDIWSSLNKDNKISLLVRFVGRDGSTVTRIRNKNK